MALLFTVYSLIMVNRICGYSDTAGPIDENVCTRDALKEHQCHIKHLPDVIFFVYLYPLYSDVCAGRSFCCFMCDVSFVKVFS